MRQRAMAAKVGMWFARASTRPIQHMSQVAVGPKACPGVSTQKALTPVIFNAYSLCSLKPRR